MAGRGRGRGRGLSLTQEQIQTLGITRTEIATNEPPPLFPKLINRPLPLPNDAATDYMLVVRQQFAEFMRESPTFVTAKVVKDSIERYSDKYKLISQSSHPETISCNWEIIPTELRPHIRQERKPVKRKPKDITEITLKLQTLEKKEKQDEKTDDIGEDGKQKSAADSDEEELGEGEEEERDFEVDEGTDYANNYFDNGEDYEDEDDNLDDGPVY